MYRVLLPFFLFTCAHTHAQCPITVSAGADQFVCNNGGTTTLDGSIGGPEIAFLWSPATGLSSTTVLNPTATVNGTATYTLTAAAEDPSAPNLVNNPGFESGNTGYTTGYTYNNTPITPGTYVLTTSPSLVFSNFPPCDDHTFMNGTGLLMLCNGTGGANQQIWCQNITVMPNSWYILGVWAICSPISPPTLQFRINNVNVGAAYPVVSGICNWQQYTAVWYSGSATSANFCIFDVSGSGNGLFGDDFAIDDVSMVKACTVQDQVTVSVASVNAVLPNSVILPCNAAMNGIPLNGSASSSGPGYTYAWSGPGILSGDNTPVAVVNEPGTYTLTVTFDTGNGACSDEATIQVLPDPNVPTAQAATLDDLNCENATATLSGTGSSVGPQYSYVWEPVAFVSSGGTTLNPEVNQPGEYTLIVTNNTSGCTATASTSVEQYNTPAVATASVNGQLGCGTSTLTLSGAGSSAGPENSYLWTGPGIQSGSTTLNNCVVNQPGVYTLTVFNDVSLCTATAFVNVTQNNQLPLAVANASGSLSCTNNTVTLNSNGSSNGANITYQWSASAGGQISGSSNGATATAIAPGMYQLVVTNTQNGCSASTTVTVNGNNTLPTVVIQPPASLNCAQDSIQLNASGSSSGSGFTVHWTASAGGVLLSGSNSLTPWTGAAGNYTLTIQNSANGCTNTATISVGIDTLSPVVLIAPPGMLDCQTSQVTLDATASSPGTALWSFTGSGNGITAGQGTLTPTVASAGLYTLVITSTANQCSNSASVSVQQDGALPIANAGPTPVLNCATPSAILNGSGSSQGVQFAYDWSTGDTTLQTTITAPGTYVLSVTNITNNCVAADTVVVALSSGAPVINIAPPDTLTCAITQVVLQANAAANPNFVFDWTYTGTGNGILSGDSTLQPTVGLPGWYFLSVTDTLNGCSGLDSIQVTISAIPPVADAGTPQTLLCGTTSLTLNGSLSSAGQVFSYLWTTGNGNILSGSTSLTPVVNAAGVYVLSVKDTLNGCIAKDTVLVDQDANAPVAIAGPAQILTCFSNSVTLNGNGSTTGPNINYVWSSSDGAIFSGQGTLQPVVTAAGTYTLQVTNTNNNCQSISTVQVVDSTSGPQINLPAPAPLTCNTLQTTLFCQVVNVSVSIVYNWQGANIISGGNSSSPTAGAIGMYTVTVTNTANGCSTTGSTTVIDNIVFPQAQAGAPIPLSCSATTVGLTATGSDTGTDFTYAWSGPGIVSGGTTFTPQVNAAGVYTLTVTNQSNGCFSTATATLGTDLAPPIAVANAPTGINCNQAAVALDGAGSSTGPGINYLWSGPGILSGGATLSPLVQTAGIYTITVTNQNNGCSATASTLVNTSQTPPVAVASAPQAFTCIVNQVTLSGTGSSTGPGIFYQWTGFGIISGANTLSPLVGSNNTYTLVVTDQNTGCTASATATTTQDVDPPFAQALSGPALNCSLNQSSVDGSGSSTGPQYQYEWIGAGISGSNTGISIQVTAPGPYSLIVTDTTNGCNAVSTAIVLQNTTLPQAAANANQTLSCSTTQVTLLGSGSSTGPQFSYQWSGPGISAGASTLTPTVNLPGIYTLTVTNSINTCTATASFNLAGNTTPPTAVASAPQALSCSVQQTSLSAAGSSTGVGIQYQWQGPGIVSGGSTLSPTVNVAGVYTLTVTNTNNGCAASTSVTLSGNSTPLSVSIAAAAGISCLNPQVTLQGSVAGGGSGFQFSWNTSNGNILSGNTTLTPVVTQAGVYTLQVSNPANGCTGTASVSVGGNTLPPSVNAGPDITLNCGLSLTQLSGSSNVSNAVAVWSSSNGSIVSGGNTLSASVNAAGTYLLTVSNPANGCTASDAVAVVVNTPVFPQPTLVPPDCATLQGSIVFKGGSGGAFPFRFSIDGGLSFEADSVFNQLPAGSYSYQIYDQNGCLTEGDVTLPPVIQPQIQLPALITADLGTTIALEPVFNLPLGALNSLQWSPEAGLSCSDCAAPQVTALSDGVYTLTISTLNGCTASATIRIQVQWDEHIFIPNAFSPNDDGLNDNLLVSTNLIPDFYECRVFDRWGGLMYLGNDIQKSWDGRWREREMVPGVYVCWVRLRYTDPQGASREIIRSQDVLLMR
jgi:gliding motility-associated-like protein